MPAVGVVFADVVLPAHRDQDVAVVENLILVVDHVGNLGRLATLPIAGCIVGRALYDGRFSLRDALSR